MDNLLLYDSIYAVLHTCLLVAAITLTALTIKKILLAPDTVRSVFTAVYSARIAYDKLTRKQDKTEKDPINPSYYKNQACRNASM